LVQDPQIFDRVRRIAEQRRSLFQARYGDDGGLDIEDMLAGLEAAATRLAVFVADTTDYLHQSMAAGKAILFEGANGVLLDVDHGTYPFVTSSSTGPHGIGPGAGVFPSEVACRIGVIKAYATRVGSGPFVTELENATGDRIREQGQEYGTTTGRPRRCGWFDAVSCRYAAKVSGATHLSLMHLDTLSGFDEIGICTGYRCEGRTLTTPPTSVRLLEKSEPVIEYLPGWAGDLRGARIFEDLPEAARGYVARVEELVGVKVAIAGVGPDRSQTIVRGDLESFVRVPEPTAVQPQS
jgi:adenylosuccinate synthase